VNLSDNYAYIPKVNYKERNYVFIILKEHARDGIYLHEVTVANGIILTF